MTVDSTVEEWLAVRLGGGHGLAASGSLCASVRPEKKDECRGLFAVNERGDRAFLDIGDSRALCVMRADLAAENEGAGGTFEQVAEKYVRVLGKKEERILRVSTAQTYVIRSDALRNMLDLSIEKDSWASSVEQQQNLQGTPAVDARCVASPESNINTAVQELEFLRLGMQLKSQVRTGWMLRGVPAPESVADHTFGVALCAMLVHDPAIDWRRATLLALLHDLAEALVGDFAPGQISEAGKKKAEQEAMRKLLEETLQDCPRALELRELVDEYENRTSPEARLVKDLDRFEMILQADAYERRDASGNKLEEFFSGVRGKIEHPLVQALHQALEQDRALRLAALL